MDIIRRDTDYALRLMVNLAGSEKCAVSARMLAGQEDVSYELSCKLMQKLASAGLVRSVMGSRGGYRLSKAAGRISLLDVVEAIQGLVRLNRCLLSDEACHRRQACPVRAKLGELQGLIDEYFASVSLRELASGREKTR